MNPETESAARQVCRRCGSFATDEDPEAFITVPLPEPPAETEDTTTVCPGCLDEILAQSRRRDVLDQVQALSGLLAGLVLVALGGFALKTPGDVSALQWRALVFSGTQLAVYSLHEHRIRGLPLLSLVWIPILLFNYALSLAEPGLNPLFALPALVTLLLLRRAMLDPLWHFGDPRRYGLPYEILQSESGRKWWNVDRSEK